jgi:multidrug efflux pump subunit AcrA (membrane-fusion protein)
MKAAAELDEMNASKVAAGQRATIRLDANADVAIEGAVAHIEEAVQQRSPTDPRKVVKLDITLDEQDKVELRPGMRFRGTVETDRVAGVLQVPLAAIHATPEGAVVYKKSGAGAGAEPVPVTLGRRGSERVEITGGLVEGDRVALLDRAGRGSGSGTGGGEAR